MAGLEREPDDRQKHEKQGARGWLRCRISLHVGIRSKSEDRHALEPIGPVSVISAMFLLAVKTAAPPVMLAMPVP